MGVGDYKVTFVNKADVNISVFCAIEPLILCILMRLCI
jgi:hypothetical protein